MKITNHTELRIRRQIDCSEPVLTDQSSKNSCDINVIMANYQKTGMFSHVSPHQPAYIDNTTIPNLVQAFSIARMASDMFMELPAYIRKLMDNNPANLENFIADSENREILLKHGILTSKPTTDIPKTTTESVTKPETGLE